MEDKLKRQKIKYFLFGVIGYLLGVVIYDVFGNENSSLRVIFGVIFVVIMRALFDLYQYRKHPELKRKEKHLEKDERLIIIRDRAAYITNNIILTILIILWFVAIVRKNDELAYIASCSILTFISIMKLSKYYLSKKM